MVLLRRPVPLMGEAETFDNNGAEALDQDGMARSFRGPSADPEGTTYNGTLTLTLGICLIKVAAFTKNT